MNVIVDVTTTPIEVDVTIGSEVAAKFWAQQSELFAQQASDTFDLIVPAVNQGISDINDARDQSIIDIGQAETDALVAVGLAESDAVVNIQGVEAGILGNISQAESDALVAVGGAESSAIGNIGQAESDAIVAVGQAETDAINNITPLVSDAQNAANTSTQQAILSAAARDDAEAAKIAAEGFADDAEGFKDDAEDAKDATETFANLVLASQNTAITQALGSITGTVDIDLVLGTLVTATLTDAVTFTFSGLPSTGRETAFTLRLSGLEQITFPVGTKFANGEVPTPEGALYEIPCSIDSTGALIVYGVINDISVP
jgi:hypothetical protein